MKRFLTYLLISLLVLFVFESKVYPHLQDSNVVSIPHQTSKVVHPNKTFDKSNLQSKGDLSYLIELDDLDFQFNDHIQNVALISCIAGLFTLLASYFASTKNSAFRSDALGLFHCKRFIVNRSIRI